MGSDALPIYLGRQFGAAHHVVLSRWGRIRRVLGLFELSSPSRAVRFAVARMKTGRPEDDEVGQDE